MAPASLFSCVYKRREGRPAQPRRLQQRRPHGPPQGLFSLRLSTVGRESRVYSGRRQRLWQYDAPPRATPGPLFSPPARLYGGQPRIQQAQAAALRLRLLLRLRRFTAVGPKAPARSCGGPRRLRPQWTTQAAALRLSCGGPLLFAYARSLRSTPQGPSPPAGPRRLRPQRTQAAALRLRGPDGLGCQSLQTLRFLLSILRGVLSTLDCQGPKILRSLFAFSSLDPHTAWASPKTEDAFEHERLKILHCLLSIPRGAGVPQRTPTRARAGAHLLRLRSSSRRAYAVTCGGARRGAPHGRRPARAREGMPNRLG